jgi:manganese-dependent inorganic pyrophosphatase
MTKMIRRLCPPAGQSAEFGEVTVSMRNLARALGATTPAVFNPGPEERLTLTLATMSPGAFAKRLEAGSPRAHLVLAGDNPAIQELAIRAGVRALVLTHGAGADDALLEEARRHEVSVLLTAHNTAASAMLCHAAASIGHMVHEQFLPFHEDDLLAEVRAQATDSPFRAFPVLDAENRTVGILSKSDFLKKVRRQLILVDHNEFSQAVPGADQVEILEVIDHHRLSVHSAVPILVHNEPVGSTSTIVADFFFRSPVEMPRAVAGLLMAGLVSDTLNLSSPTTTDKDRVILGRLEQLAQTKASEFIEKLFASGSVLVSRPAEQAVTADCKEFTHKGRTFSAAQIEELGFDPFWKRKDEVFAALEAYRRQKRYDFSALLVTDVTRQTSILLMTGSAAVAKQISHPRLEAGLYEMPGMVSRKKQLLPYLLECVDKAGPPPATAA